MTKQELSLIQDYVYEMVSSLKAEIIGEDPYWSQRRADEAIEKLYELVEDEE